MPHAKPASLRKTQTRAVTLLGVAGALSLVAGASPVGPAVDTPTENTPPLITHGEEEIAGQDSSICVVRIPAGGLFRPDKAAS